MQGSTVSYKTALDGDGYNVRFLKGREFVKQPNPA
jgi:hypothetical protein